jgi:adenylate kinase family enzyme
MPSRPSASPADERHPTVLAVVLTGPPGAGKTAVLTALSDALSDDDISHAAVEVEALVWTHPALSDEQRWRQVHTACTLYREAGHRLLLVAETLETNDDLTALQGAVGADEYFVVRLQAQPATLVERIVHREPPGWSGLAALVEHTQELALSMPALDGVDLVLTTDGQHPEEMAARIRAAYPRRLHP